MELEKTAEEVVKLLKEQGLFISTAESLTGGMLASSIVGIAGASDVFAEGYITYSDAVKHKVLDVGQTALKEYTAVSSIVAGQMAEGVAKAAGTKIAVSTTGYAGPGAADGSTPAGTVYIGIFYKGNTCTKKFCFKGDRNSVRCQTVYEALKMVKEKLA